MIRHFHKLHFRWQTVSISSVTHSIQQRLHSNKTAIKQKLFLILGIVSLVIGGSLWITQFREKGSDQSSSRTRQKLAEFRLLSMEGAWVSANSLKGSVALLHFWATWCAPCLGELPEFLELATNESLFTSKSKRRVQLVPISLDKSWKEAKKIFPETYHRERILPLLDSNAEVAEKLGSYQYPETYLVDSQGVIRAKWVGPQDWKNPIVLAMIRKTIDED